MKNSVWFNYSSLFQHSLLPLDKVSNSDSAKDQFDFAPGILGVQTQPPSPLPRMVLRGVVFIFPCVFIILLFPIVMKIIAQGF